MNRTEIRKHIFLMKNKSLIVLLMLVCMSLLVHAQDVKMTLSAPSEVAVGQRFAVTYEVNARPSNFETPTFTNFNYEGGPAQSQQHSSQYINGKATHYYSVSYTYYLSASWSRPWAPLSGPC